MITKTASRAITRRRIRILCILAGIMHLLRLPSIAAVENSVPISSRTFVNANWSSLNPRLPGVDGGVNAVAVDSAGNAYIGGRFTMAGDVLANNIAKWDGSRWTALGSGIQGAAFGRAPVVWALAVSGNDLYVGGSFTNAGGKTANSIAKWDGREWKPLGSGIRQAYRNNSVYALAISGNDLYVGGQFSSVGDSEDAFNSIAKWNGITWAPLQEGFWGVSLEQANAAVFSLAVSGNDLYAAGSFMTPGGGVTNFAKWNGDTWSALGSPIAGTSLQSISAATLAVSGGALYACGSVEMTDGTSTNFLARWNGNEWTLLGSAGGLEFANVFALAASGNDLYAGGFFRTVAGTPANSIAKWNGTSWSALGSGITNVGGVIALAVSGNRVYAGGSFAMAGGKPANSIAQWDGTAWTGLPADAADHIWNSSVMTFAASGTNLYAGGAFTTADGRPANGVAQWDESGWTGLGWGLRSDSPYEPSASAMAASGNTLYVGGYFTTAGDVTANHIAKWNGSSWSSLGSGMNAGVKALAIAENDLFAAGDFTTAGGLAATNVARWNGTNWSALGPGLRATAYPGVVALAASGSDLYVGGSFKTVGAAAAANIARWDGTKWSALGSGIGGITDAAVFALTVAGRDLYAGGWFTKAGGTPANGIAKWDGSRWSALGSGIGGPSSGSDYRVPRVTALVISGNNLYAGGWFTTAGGNTANYIAEWDGTVWTPLGSGMNSEVLALASLNNHLFVGGLFTSAGANASAYIARAYLPNLPTLSILRAGAQVTVKWVSADTSGFALEQTPALGSAPAWVANSDPVTDDGVKRSVTLPSDNGTHFFRLQRR